MSSRYSPPSYTPPAAGQTKGTTTNDNASAGNVGEYVESVVGAATVSISPATGTSITSISLTSGDWDVEGNIHFAPNAITQSIAGCVGIISTSPTSGNPNDGTESYGPICAAGNSLRFGLGITRRRFSLSTTTTIYLDCFVGYAGGSLQAGGILNARRVR